MKHLKRMVEAIVVMAAVLAAIGLAPVFERNPVSREDWRMIDDYF